MKIPSLFHIASMLTAGIPLFAILPAFAQSPDDFGDLVAIREHVAWPSPESIVRNLRSSNDDDRLKGLALFAGDLRHLQNDGVLRPTQIELRYAALGSDETQQAILAIQVGQDGFVAVATPKGNAWERIGQFNCWCKYDMSHFLDEFVTLNDAPGGHELVLRSSGGGSDLYEQEEVHIRFHHEELKPVLNFVSRRVNDHVGIPKPYLEIQRRWFGFDTRGAVLVEGSVIRPDSMPSLPELDMGSSVRDLESRLLGPLTCRPYRWNGQAFRWEPSSAASPCKASQPSAEK